MPYKRYILNVAESMAHDRHNLHEECNTDAIKKRRNVDVVPEGYNFCQHCCETPEPKP